MNKEADFVESRKALSDGWRSAVVAPFPEEALMLQAERSRRRRLHGAVIGSSAAAVAIAAAVAVGASGLAVGDGSIRDERNDVADTSPQIVPTGEAGEWVTVTFPDVEVRPLAGGLWQVGSDGANEPLYQVSFFESEQAGGGVAYLPWDQQLPIPDAGVASDSAVIRLPESLPSGEYSVCLGFDDAQCVPVQVN